MIELSAFKYPLTLLDFIEHDNISMPNYEVKMLEND